MKIKAFTLSEVMMVLSVIGVIAALTIPGIMQNAQNRQAVTRLKRTYSLFSQAYTSMVSEYESIENIPEWSGTDDDVLNAFSQKIVMLKKCYQSDGCMPAGKNKLLNGTLSIYDFEPYSKAILADGTGVAFKRFSSNCTGSLGGKTNNITCGEIYVDINGPSPPNQTGRDIFDFWLTQKGILARDINESCGNDCNSGGAGASCATKVLTENAINY